MTNWENNFSSSLPLRKILLFDKNLSLKTWSRSFIITKDLCGMRVRVHNGKDFVPLLITPEMSGHKLGEFVGTRARYEFKKKKKKK